MKKLAVQSTVIHWPEKELVITDTTETKHTVSLDYFIQVTMIGFPARETKTMQARDLGEYMTKGYIIQQISYEEEHQQ